MGEKTETTGFKEAGEVKAMLLAGAIGGLGAVFFMLLAWRVGCE